MGFLRLMAIAGLLGLSTGCVGIYSNKELFLNEPAVGTSEVDTIKQFGAPDFNVETGANSVFTYKVRDVMYFILFGIYRGYDLVVVFENGLVNETHRVQRPKTVTLFQPVPWAVQD